MHPTGSVWAYCIYVSPDRVKAGTGRAALQKLFLFGSWWLVSRACVPPPSWSVSSPGVVLLPLHSAPPPSPLPLILFPLTLICCDLDADNGRTAPPFLTSRQLTHFQRGITLFPHISLMALQPFPLCSWKYSPPLHLHVSFHSPLMTNSSNSHWRVIRQQAPLGSNT